MKSNSNGYLSRPEFHILQVLLMRDYDHGYHIMQEVRNITDQKVDLPSATLYRTIRGLQKRGYVKEVKPPKNELENDDERRRYYKLTPNGVEVIRDEVNTMQTSLTLLERFANTSLVPIKIE